MTASINDLAQAIDALTTASEHSGGIYAESLINRIERIGETPSHQAFLELCELAMLAYPEGEPCDEAILKNAATPALIRYVLDSFRSYSGQLHSERSKPDTPKRAEFLQFAFGARSPKRGGNTRNAQWDEAQQQEIYLAFSKTFHSCHSAGMPVQAAWQAGFDAGYEFAFGSDSLRGREPQQVKKNETKLEALINKHQPRSTIFK